MFGSTAALARALEVTPQAIYQWPEQLDQRRADQVRGAMVRLGISDDPAREDVGTIDADGVRDEAA